MEKDKNKMQSKNRNKKKQVKEKMKMTATRRQTKSQRTIVFGQMDEEIFIFCAIFLAQWVFAIE